MTTDHDSDPDATVKMPRPAPRKDVDIEQFDPESTLVRDNWGGADSVLPQEGGAAKEPSPPPDEAQPDWEKTLRRPSYKVDTGPR
jgi:hypothetical protein